METTFWFYFITACLRAFEPDGKVERVSNNQLLVRVNKRTIILGDESDIQLNKQLNPKKALDDGEHLCGITIGYKSVPALDIDGNKHYEPVLLALNSKRHKKKHHITIRNAYSSYKCPFCDIYPEFNINDDVDSVPLLFMYHFTGYYLSGASKLRKQPVKQISTHEYKEPFVHSKHQGCYLIQLNCDEGTNKYKIGKSKDLQQRLKTTEYRNCFIYSIMYTSDENECEKEIIREFDSHFIQVKHDTTGNYGRETYRGDIREMMKLFHEICSKYV